MPEIEYTAFLRHQEMKDKYDYMQSFRVDSKHDIAKTSAAFGAFTEGLQLFSSFAILLNLPRHHKMKGMGHIVSWSVRDETLHCLSVIRLFRTFVQENPEIWTADLKQQITGVCATIVVHEDAFIDLAFEQDPIEGMNPAEVKQYIRYIASRLLLRVGLDELYNVEGNPLPWLDDMLNSVGHADFFENRSTEYSRANTQGSWEEAFAGDVFATEQPQSVISCSASAGSGLCDPEQTSAALRTYAGFRGLARPRDMRATRHASLLRPRGRRCAFGLLA